MLIFVFFFLAEYASIVLMSILTSILFLGGYLLPFQSFIGSLNNSILDGLISGVTLGFKACIIIFGFVWVRASFPRIRYDQLMTVCWTVLLPLVFAFIFLVPCVIIALDAVPTNISVLFFPGLIASFKNSGLNNNKPKPADLSTLFLPLEIVKTYCNLNEQSTINLIKEDLKALAGVYAFKYNITGMMYIGSTANLWVRFNED